MFFFSSNVSLSHQSLNRSQKAVSVQQIYVLVRGLVLPSVCEISHFVKRDNTHWTVKRFGMLTVLFLLNRMPYHVVIYMFKIKKLY